MFQLTAANGLNKGKNWTISEQPIIIGRASDCDIVILDPAVSRRHCQIWTSNGVPQMRDLGSRNLAQVNGRTAEEYSLEVGDEIRLGSSVFFMTANGDSRGLPVSSITLGEHESTFMGAARQSTVDLIEQPGVYIDLQNLFRISTRLSCSASRQDLLQVLRTALQERFQPMAAWLVLLTEEHEELLSLHGDGTPPRDLMRTTLENRSGALIPPGAWDAKGEPAWLLVAPLSLANLQVGALALISEPHKILDRADLDYLVALACMVSPFFKAIERLEQIKAENARLRSGKEVMQALVGKDPRIDQVKRLVQMAAPSLHSVLITGETGTGKEVVAGLVHALSERKNEPLITMNCAAIPRELFESELFGYEKGAFTGANAAKKGLIEQSHKGTLFLDEIGDLSLENQAKILRAVETKTFRRVGGNSEIQSDFRLIAATNKDLSAEIKNRQFREDLFHRLNTIKILLPPLRDRKGDIPDLARHFLAHCPEAQKRTMQFSPEAMQFLIRHPWPGNVRELKHTIERAATLSRTEVVQLESLRLLAEPDPDQSRHILTLAEVEKKHILDAFNACNNNVLETAKQLGIGKSTLYNKLAEYGVRA